MHKEKESCEVTEGEKKKFFDWLDRIMLLIRWRYKKTYNITEEEDIPESQDPS